ncbi:MAG TPA: type II secretion system protein GspK [Phycisphaerae bacterium]|nr:type II secretion system protein GspK [Phycisphaerae bacterium]
MNLLNLNPNVNRNLNRSRGAALITTIWVIIIISGIALIMSRAMRVETLASANRLSQLQADMTERGAEQFLCSVVDQEVATPGSTATVGMEARQIGDGYFWVLKMDPNNQQNRAFGLTDEASKIDLNTATLTTSGGGMLQMLPNMPADVASSIYNWRGTGTSPDGLGATDQDYESLPDAYLCKHAPFETTEELRLVKGVDDALLFGSDRNRDGYLDASEQTSAGPAASINSGNTSAVGIFPFVTAYGVQATTSTSTSSSSGQRLVNVNLSPVGGGGGRGGGAVSLNSTALRNALQTAGVSNVTGIITNTVTNESSGRSFSSVLAWAATVNMTSADLSKVYTQLTATPLGGAATAKVAKINVNDAPKQVLMCLPGLEESDADAIIAQRQTTTSTTPADISWMLDAIAHNKLAPIGSYLTGTSTVFSGDILAISPDGRAFRRYRVVIDGTKSPAYVIYRRDLTRYGWPLTSDIRDALRAGNPPPDANAAASSSNTPFGQGI